MNNTKIEWCDSTWNPVTGCLHGCEYCYARKIAERFKGSGDLREAGSGFWLDKDNFEVSSGVYETKYALTTGEKPKPFEPYSGKITPYPFGFSPTFHRYRLDIPRKWTEPRTIFVCSMADLFGEWVPDKWIEAVFEACEKAPQHRYLFLTKNPQRYIELDGRNKLPIRDNMWYGATASNNEQLSEVINSFGYFEKGYLEKEPKTFLSIEPILENVNINNIHLPTGWYKDYGAYVDWVIIGAESGNRKDKVIPPKVWIDSISEKCKYDVRVSVFMKDSLIPVIGEENMRREFPWEASK